MNGSTVDLALAFYWAECYTFSDADGFVNIGGLSPGLIVLFITLSVEVFLGVPSNLWLVCHILRNRSKITGILPADFFPFHLTLTQFLFYLNVPVIFGNHLLWRSAFLLKIMIIMSSLMLVMKPLLLCMTCVERYIAVVQPLVYLRFKASKYRWGCLGSSWCIFVSLTTVALYRGTPVSVCVLFFPILSIDTFCCFSILKTLQKPPPGDKTILEVKGEGNKHKNMSGEVQVKEEREKKGGRVDNNKTRGKGERYLMKKKAFITIVIIQAVLTFNYFPFIIAMILNGLVPPRTQRCQVVAVSMAAATCCTYLQPLGKLPSLKTRNT